MRRVLRDKALNKKLQRDGYVVVPFADRSELRGLLEVYERLDAGISSGYYASMHSKDGAYKKAADEEIRSRFWAHLDALVVDHEPVVAAFMIKHPGDDSWVPPHQDWIITDEESGGAINCWFPVTEVDDTVGRMSVLPGSHRYLEGLRGSPFFPTQIGDISREIADELLEPIEVAVGEAIIYENRLLHGTPPNRSDATRVVAYISAIPQGAPRLHYYRDSEGTVEGYRVDEEFYTTFNIGEQPRGEKFVEIPGYDIPALSLADLERQHKRARRWKMIAP